MPFEETYLKRPLLSVSHAKSVEHEMRSLNICLDSTSAFVKCYSTVVSLPKRRTQGFSVSDEILTEKANKS